MFSQHEMEACSPLTPVQQGMLTLSIDKENKSNYIIQTVFAWEEIISPALFEAAWKELAHRHDALRSRFAWQERPEPAQIITPDAVVDFEVRPCSGRSPEEKQHELVNFLDADLDRGFDLRRSPPWRITALQYPGGRVTAVWTFHHLLIDGRSHVVLLKELLEIYDALLSGGHAALVPEVSPRVFAEWFQKQDFSSSKDYWQSYLNRAPQSTSFPPKDLPAARAHLNGPYNGQFGPQLTAGLKAFSAATGVTIGNIVQASWAFVVGWLANESDVVIGAVRACRKSSLQGVENVIGVLINTLPLRVQWNAQSTVEEALAVVAKDWYRFREVEQTPLQQIRHWTNRPSGAELFSAVVSFSSPHFLAGVFGESPARERRHIWLRQTTPYCSLDAGLAKDNLLLSFNLPGIAPELAAQFPRFLENTVQGMVSNAGQRVSALSPLGSRAGRQLIFATNNRWEPPPDVIDWIDRIAEHAAHRELEQKSNQLARFLESEGVKQGDLVAVLLPRSPDFIWTCLGILKAGAAYLPLDAQWPEQRLAAVLQDAQAVGTLTNEGLAARLSGISQTVWTPLEKLSAHSGAPLNHPAPHPNQLAYVIYTSGSSGIPKGVEITHRGLQNLIEDAIATFSLTPNDRGSWVSNTAFDASVHELWPLLAAGASIHIPDPDLLQDPLGLLKWLADQRITISFLSVIMAEALTKLAPARALSLRYLLTGGDRLRVAPTGDLSFQLVNEYGPTEYSVVATRYPVTRSFDGAESIPIGKPLRATRAYVMNDFQQLLPRGTQGELVLAGSGLARGYRNSPALTAQKFVASSLPQETATTLYRTGDLVRWLDDANLQFLGRIDSQVKLRGFRIELGEIEASLLHHKDVAEAVVILKSDPAPCLVAFVVPADESLRPVLIEHLKNSLPEYMVPAHFVFRENLPVNTSGKYDRRQLESIPIPRQDADAEENAAFASPLEEKIAAIWEEILSVPGVRPNDRFLSLGGTSLSIIRLISAIGQQFSAEIPVAEVFRDPTPADLANLIEGLKPSGPEPLVALQERGSKSPIFCLPGAGGGVHWFRNLALAMDQERPVIGVELLALSSQQPGAFSFVSATEEITDLISSYGDKQDCSLCGYSGGGLMALEVARNLRARGKHVSHVFLLDTYPPTYSVSNIAKAERWLRGWWSLPLDERLATLGHRLHALYKKQGQSAHPAAQWEKDLSAVKQLHIEAFMRHRLEPSIENVTLFFAEDRPLSVRAAVDHDWSEWLTRGFRTVMLPGDHYTLLQEKNAHVLARHFSDILGENHGAADPASSSSDHEQTEKTDPVQK